MNRYITGDRPVPDFLVQNHGSICILWPRTGAAQDWCVDHLDPLAPQRWGDGYVVEHRYITDVVDAVISDGYDVIWS